MAMKRLMILLAFLLPAAGCHPAAKARGETFYLQVIRGGDSDVPPSETSKPIGQKLRTKLQCAFKWKHYWEIKRERLEVTQGRKVREVISPAETVELELLEPENVTVRMYSSGRLVRSRRQPAHNAFCVTGAPLGEDQSWFIVVRRDEPQTGDGP